MLFLYDASRTLIDALPEYESVVEVRRFFDHGTINAKLRLADLDSARGAYFATIGDSDKLYLVEQVTEVTDGIVTYVELQGREATALLSLRTIVGTVRYTNTASGAVIKGLIDALTGDRAIAGLAFGNGDDLGTAITLERSWGDLGEAVREIAAADNLGLKAYLSGTDILIDVFAPSAVSQPLGEVYRDGSASTFARDISEWRNYAIVLGEQPEAVFQTASTKTLVYGGTVSGSGTSVDASDSVPWQLSENGTNGIRAEFEFTVPASYTAGESKVRAYYVGTAAHYINLEAYDYTTSTWELLDQSIIPSGGSTYMERKATFYERHINRSTNRAKFALVHNVATYNASHRLYIDEFVASFAPPRTRVDVDLTGADELRELYVDARDLQREADGVILSVPEYAAVLTQRGTEKLADARVIEYVDADSSAQLTEGDLVWYDSGRWQVELLATEVSVTHEKGTERYGATLGEPPATLRKTIRKETTKQTAGR